MLWPNLLLLPGLSYTCIRIEAILLDLMSRRLHMFFFEAVTRKQLFKIRLPAIGDSSIQRNGRWLQRYKRRVTTNHLRIVYDE